METGCFALAEARRGVAYVLRTSQLKNT